MRIYEGDREAKAEPKVEPKVEKMEGCQGRSDIASSAPVEAASTIVRVIVADPKKILKACKCIANV